MLVYGDHKQQVDPRHVLECIRRRSDEVAAMPAGVERHAALTGLFIDLAALTQGIADFAFQASVEDDRRAPEAALMGSLVALGRALITSWDSGFVGLTPLPLLPAIEGLPEHVEISLPEGYAFYALYPEAYALAARRLQLTGPPRIIGLRSIGTGLAAITAAALDAPLPFTVRPHGDPFARTLAIAAPLEAALLDGSPHYVIVDEGPGLSGSSFGAVADWLEERGVPAERIAFLPGHDHALGSQANERHSARWVTAQRPVVGSDALLAGRLEAWISELVGVLTKPLQDISGGAWRHLRSLDESAWPATNPTWERRKFLARTRNGAWLIKFAGLGAIGERKLELARQLHSGGFGAEPVGLAHGWLIERWHQDAQPAWPSLDELTAYQKFRRGLSAPAAGAPLDALVTMARRNAPKWLADWSPDTRLLLRRLRPVAVDGRMERHEWLRLPDGRLLKTDALDHHAAHDLIGCQDIGWDVAGAIVEFELDGPAAEELRRRLDIDPDLLDFMLRCYLAFRIGARRLSADMLSHWPTEAERNRADAERYERRLSALVNVVEHA